MVVLGSGTYHHMISVPVLSLETKGIWLDESAPERMKNAFPLILSNSREYLYIGDSGEWIADLNGYFQVDPNPEFISRNEV